MGLSEIDWSQIGFHFYHLGIAFILALPVGFNREHEARGAGLRTFPLVSIASCAYMLVGMQMFQGSGAESRVMYGIITGMGFIGGGAILKHRASVLGTATAASIWNTGAIGISVASDFYEIAIILSLINFIILRFATPLKKENTDDPDSKESSKQAEEDEH